VKAFLATQNFTEGTIVNKGQTLFTLDCREYTAQLEQAQAQLAKAQADQISAREKTAVETAQANVAISEAQLNKGDQDVKRLKPLAEQQAVPQQDYDNALAYQQGARADLAGRKASLNTTLVTQKAQIQQADAGVLAAKAGVEQAQLNVSYCNITSPITGLAGTRMVAPGNLVGQGEPTLLVTVSSVNPMRMLVSISERDYLLYEKIQRGKKAQPKTGIELVLADGSAYPQKGKIVTVDRAIDLKTGTLSLIAEFPNPTGVLRPGQFGRVRLAATTAENALLVPQKAVTELQSSKVVYVVLDDNKVQLRTVTLGNRVDNNYYIVTDGVKAGERIVVEGILKVRPGATVEPVSAPVSSEVSAEKKGM
jgi:membrane fusion protein (multidrug efflux system)